MNKLFLIIFLIGFSFSAHAFDPCDQQTKYVPIAERYKKGLLFVVKKCGVAPSYILGTLHSDDPKITAINNAAFSKLAYANTATFEIKFNKEALMVARQSMYIDSNSIDTLQNMVGISPYNDFVNLLKKLHPESDEKDYYRMKPWAAAVFITEPVDNYDGIPLDLKLQNFAAQRNIPVYGLETPESQLAIFNGLTNEQQIGLFKDAVQNFPQTQKDIKEMFDAYLDTDLTKIKTLADKAFETYSDKELAGHLKLEMVDKRNRTMADGISSKIDLGNSFVAIGALHLPGKEGVLHLLENKGYYIEMPPEMN